MSTKLEHFENFIFGFIKEQMDTIVKNEHPNNYDEYMLENMDDFMLAVLNMFETYKSMNKLKDITSETMSTFHNYLVDFIDL